MNAPRKNRRQTVTSEVQRCARIVDRPGCQTVTRGTDGLVGRPAGLSGRGKRSATACRSCGVRTARATLRLGAGSFWVRCSSVAKCLSWPAGQDIVRPPWRCCPALAMAALGTPVRAGRGASVLDAPHSSPVLRWRTQDRRPASRPRMRMTCSRSSRWSTASGPRSPRFVERITP